MKKKQNSALRFKKDEIDLQRRKTICVLTLVNKNYIIFIMHESIFTPVLG